ncbi:MAG: hypothetical protein AAF602_10065 [Myxococcota bacterium]
MRWWFVGAGLAVVGCSPEPEVIDIDPGQVSDIVRIADGPRSNQRVIEVSLAEPEDVAVLCVANHDPEERILVESTMAAEHVVRLSGLRPEATYRCRVATPDGVEVFDLVIGPAPVPFTPMQTTIDPELGMTGAWTLMVRPGVGTDHSWLVIYDALGEARWWHALPQPYQSVEALYHPEDDTIVWGGGDRGVQDGYPGVVSLWQGEQRIEVPGFDTLRFHHDGVRLDDGRFVTLETVPNRLGEQEWAGFQVRVHDPVDQTVDFAFHSQRYVDEGILRVPPPGRKDPYHANWMDYVETDDGPVLYVSLCLSWTMLAIDGLTGDLIWEFRRDRDWTVLDETGADVGEDILPQCQHGVEVDGDRFWLYDNGRSREFSSADLWQIDGDARVARRLHHWTEAGWHDRELGDIDVLSEDRIFLTQGRIGGEKENTELVEVDLPTGRVASRQRFLENGRGYRAERLDGCDLFDRVDNCPALQERLDTLSNVFVD